MNVTYIAQYANIQECGERYKFSPGGVAKMEYFLYCLQQLGIQTRVFSLCLSQKAISIPRRGKSIYGQPVRYALSFRPCIKGLSLLLLVVLQIQLFFKILFSRKDEIFFVYHERFYMPAINMARRLRRVKIIIDIEEIYSIHAQLSAKKTREEIEYLKSFDRYTLANVYLADELKLTDEKYAICNGIYAPVQKRKPVLRQRYTTVLYAGTFDNRKGGAMAAINAFRLLDRHYQLYVCGFGTEAETDEIIECINAVNAAKGYKAIIYEGFVSNRSRRYSELLGQCDIGLSTQKNVGKYNSTSFPSKIFEYMRYGIKVVSATIPGSERLPVSDYITFINSNTAEDVANGIVRCAMSASNDGQAKALADMHHNFIYRFKNLLDL